MKKLFILLFACILTPTFAQSVCEHPLTKTELKKLNAELPKKITSDVFINKLTCQGDTTGYEYLLNVSTKTNPQIQREMARGLQSEVKKIACKPKILSLKQDGMQKVHIRVIDKDRFVLVDDIVPFSSCR